MDTKAVGSLIGIATLAVVLSSPVPVVSARASAILNCARSVVETGNPPATNRAVLGNAALPRTSFILQLDPPRKPGSWGFAKHGFIVRDGVSITLEVPQAYRRLYLLSAAYVAGSVPLITFRACPDYHLGNWTIWVGGYAARRPLCAPLIVHSGARSARVTISIGRHCG